MKYTQECSNEERKQVQLILLEEIQKACGKTLIVIDFTRPEAVKTNWTLYCELKIPFVLGTTGFDHLKLIKETKQEDVFAVIAPNMCKQIVALQSMLQTASDEFPGCFNEYSLSITESHQKEKVDTSGTAKAMLKYFNALVNGNTQLAEVNKIRDEDEQKAFGVPETALNGHAYHTYSLESSDKTVQFEFKHNVQGRKTYAEGALDAVLFLANRMENFTERSEQKVFDMIDVLKGGSMR